MSPEPDRSSEDLVFQLPYLPSVRLPDGSTYQVTSQGLVPGDTDQEGST